MRCIFSRRYYYRRHTLKNWRDKKGLDLHLIIPVTLLHLLLLLHYCCAALERERYALASTTATKSCATCCWCGHVWVLCSPATNAATKRSTSHFLSCIVHDCSKPHTHHVVRNGQTLRTLARAEHASSRCNRQNTDAFLSMARKLSSPSRSTCQGYAVV